MSAEKAKAAGGGDGGKTKGSESLEQVRDILFGAQMRSVESRLSQLEERMRRELEQTRGALEGKLAELDRRLQQELLAEREERSGVVESMRVAHGEAVLGLSSALDAVRADLAREVERWEAALDSAGAELRSELGTVAADLEARKPDAHHLAELFREVVGRLEQPAPPSEDG
jgi:hypothetical protein